MIRTFLARLQFDGRGFAGWQRQRASRSVQGEFERVLERLAGAPAAAYGAGRTDAGVHAEAMGVSFSLPERWTSAEALRALNALLPSDCWVADVQEMAAGFHARRSAISRRYRYLVGTDAGAASPFRRPFEWALCRALDPAALGAAAAIVRGEHAFEAFSVRGQIKPHHRCTVSLARWTARESTRGFEFEVEADRFLHHMVRMLVGTMVEIGLGRRDVEDMATLLAARDNAATSAPAPAHGLYFAAVTYPPSAYAAPTEERHAALQPS